MPLSKGDRIGPYEIVAPIGKGGMGEVYRAHDSRLNRDVAIKISNARFTDRFTHEARAIAALNHANTCHLYDVGPDYLVMEYVEGHDLRGPLSFDDALPIIRQLIDGIEAAHEKNIIHRDLKPANIKITPEGVVKILDFGLAKAMEPPPAQDGNPENSPTLTLAATQAGAIVGTASYMAPEQAKGKAADKRSDIWSFGVILHEMLTGKRLFQGESTVEILGSVLNKEPDLTAAPPRARRLLRWCLEKDRKLRLQAIGDARRILEEEPERAPAKPRFGIGNGAGLAAAVLLVALGALSFVHFREKPPVNQMVRFEISPPPGGAFGRSSAPAISPDGRKLAFVATGADKKSLVWVRPLNADEARPLTGTEDVTDDPIWSPDSRFLAFASGGKLKKIDATGGPAQTLCNDPKPGGGVWTPDNRILFGSFGPLQQVSAAGGTPTQLTVLDHSRNEIAHEAPAILPDGRHFLYLRVSIPLEGSGVYIGSLDAKPDAQSARKLLPDATPAVYVPSPLTGDAPGLLLFFRGATRVSAFEGTLMAQPFDAKRMELAGDAVPLAEQVSGFSASRTGVLAFSVSGTGSDSQLAWYDRKGSVLSTAGEIGQYSQLALSPDGTRAAYQRGSDLWFFEFARGGAPTRFTFGNDAYWPSWSADGSRIVFASTRGSGGGFGIYQKASNLSGQEELLYQSQEPKGFPNWSHDGRFLLYGTRSSDGKGGFWVLPLGGSTADRKPLAFLRTEFNEFGGRFSPDGRWVAYISNQSGKYEIYVLPFDPANPGSPAGGLHQISKDGGTDVRWSQGGKELVYLAPDGYLMSVAVSAAGGAFQTGTAQRLFKSPATGYGAWDVTADGKRFLIAAPPSSAAPAPESLPYHVVLNWTGLLNR